MSYLVDYYFQTNKNEEENKQSFLVDGRQHQEFLEEASREWHKARISRNSHSNIQNLWFMVFDIMCMWKCKTYQSRTNNQNVFSSSNNHNPKESRKKTI